MVLSCLVLIGLICFDLFWSVNGFFITGGCGSGVEPLELFEFPVNCIIEVLVPMICKFGPGLFRLDTSQEIFFLLESADEERFVVLADLVALLKKK